MGVERILARSREARNALINGRIAFVKGLWSWVGVVLEGDFSAWRRWKLFAGGVEVASVASGVIAGRSGRMGAVLATLLGCLRGRWRSGPLKWRHDAASGAGGQKAPRTIRCIKTPSPRRGQQGMAGFKQNRIPVRS